MIAVRGKQCDFYIERDATLIPVACVKTVTMSVNVALIEVATVDSGPDEDFEAGFTDMDIDLEGVMTFDQISMWQFHEFISTLRIKQRIKIEWIDDLGNTLSYEMWVLVKGATSTNGQKGFSGFNVSMKRCGSMVSTFNGAGGGGGVAGFDYDLDFDITE